MWHGNRMMEIAMVGTTDAVDTASTVGVDEAVDMDEMHEAVEGEHHPEPPLWRNWRYQTLTAGGFSAFTGLAIADVVFPLLILGFTGSPLLAGCFGVLQFLATIVGALPAGMFIDRHDRRRVLIVTESVRALAGMALAATLASGHVWLPQIYLVAIVLGFCQPFGAARNIAVRTVVPDGQLTRALSQQQVRTALAQLIGPAVGAALYAAGRSLPFFVCAAALALSALAAVLARFDGRPKAAQEEADTPDSHSEDAEKAGGKKSGGKKTGGKSADGALAGIRILWNQPLMRAAMLLIMVVNLIGTPIDLILIVQARHEGIPTHYIGLILAAFAAGSIFGAPLVPVVHRRMGPGWMLINFVGLLTAVLALLVLPFGGFWMAGCFIVIGMAMPALQVLMQVLILQQVPDNQRGRVMSAAMMMMSLGMPLGSGLGGLLLQVFSPGTAILAMAAATGTATLFALFQRSLRTAVWPKSV